MRLITVLAASALAMLTVTACGGTKAPSRAAYLKHGNAICTQANKTAPAVPKHPTPQQAEVAVKHLIAATKAEVRRLRALTPPKGDEQKVKAMYNAADQGVAAYEQASKDPKSSLSILSDPRPFAKANTLSRAYGLTVCAG